MLPHDCSFSSVRRPFVCITMSSGDGAPGAGVGAPIDNTNGGSSTSQSSGGTFTGYNILPLSLFLLLLLVAMLLRSLHDDDAYFILSMLLVMFNFITRSPHIIHVMIIVLIFWIKIYRYMTIFPTLCVYVVTYLHSCLHPERMGMRMGRIYVEVTTRNKSISHPASLYPG